MAVLRAVRPRAQPRVARFWALADITPSDADGEAKRKGGERALAAMERHWPTRVPGRRPLRIADIALYAYTHVAPEGGFSLRPYPAIREWLVRVASQPGHIPISD